MNRIQCWVPAMFCGFLSLILLRSMTALAGFRSPNMERHTPFFTGSRVAQMGSSLRTRCSRRVSVARSARAHPGQGPHAASMMVRSFALTL